MNDQSVPRAGEPGSIKIDTGPSGEVVSDNVRDGELIADGKAPATELMYRLLFPASRVVAHDRGGSRFRVVEVEERLTSYVTAETRYCVILRGPRLTRNGVDHSRATTWREFDGRWGAPIEELPPAVTDYLHGEDALRRFEGVSR